VGVERGRRLGLGHEALAHGGITGVVLHQHLERHLAAQRQVGGGIDRGRPSTVDDLVEAVVVDDLAGLKRHAVRPLPRALPGGPCRKKYVSDHRAEVAATAGWVG